MSDEELRTALQKLAEPVPATSRPGTRDAILAEVDRRHRRRWVRVGMAAAAVTGVAIGSTLVLPGTDDGPAPPEDSQAALGWKRIAESPLSGRQGEAAVWTGEEMVVVGGSDQPVCPALAECSGPTADERLSDGAAYDPDSDSWRRIADAPQSVTNAQAVWTGSEMVMVVPQLTSGIGSEPGQPAATLAYDPAEDSWRTLDAPPANGWQVLGAGTGEQPVYWESEETARGADWLLDPESGSWSRLPEDPFPATYDRSYAWAGDRFLFTAMVPPAAGADPDVPRMFQFAELDRGTRRWNVLPETPVRFGEAAWFVTNGQLVNPTQDWYYDGLDGSGGIYDIRTGEWRDVPEPAEISGEQTRCDLPKIGAGEHWIAGGYAALVSVNPDSAIYVASCAPLHEPHVGVWAGDELIIWGADDPYAKRYVPIGLRWTPPAPN
jgi:hypothetical protein